MAIELTQAELTAARKVSFTSLRRYRGYVTADDVQQELAIWMLKHEEKVRDWREGTGYRALYKSLSRVARRYCEKERAARVGYHPDDNVKYGVELIRGLLKDALQPRAAHEKQNKDALIRRAFESMPPLPVEVVDVRRGLKAISGRQVQVLLRYVDCVTRADDPEESRTEYQLMAEQATTEGSAPTDEAMRLRVYRALRALADKLNQPREEWPHVNNPYQGIPRRSDRNTIRQQLGEAA